MCNRRELEGLILMQVTELRGLESYLDRKYASLRTATRETRMAFFMKVLDLEKKARRLEQLVDALNEQTPQLAA